LTPYSSNPGILDWYTILVGLLALTTLTAHGANYIAVKTEGLLNIRSRRIARLAWVATIVLAVLTTLATFSVQSQISASFLGRPWGSQLVSKTIDNYSFLWASVPFPFFVGCDRIGT
jgi:cytochrome d ubiquinol oxidase subunit II